MAKAREVALTFDQDPDYRADAVRFSDLDGRHVGYDNLGATAWTGVQNLIQEIDNPVLTALWEEVQHGA